MERKRTLGVVTDETYSKTVISGLYGGKFGPPGSYSVMMMDRLEIENPNFESVIRCYVRDACRDNSIKAADLFFLQYDMINREKPLPFFSADSINGCASVIRECFDKNLFSQIRRIGEENPNIIKLLGSFVKGSIKDRRIDQIENADLLTNSKMLEGIPGGVAMCYGIQCQYVIMENAE